MKIISVYMDDYDFPRGVNMPKSFAIFAVVTVEDEPPIGGDPIGAEGIVEQCRSELENAAFGVKLESVDVSGIEEPVERFIDAIGRTREDGRSWRRGKGYINRRRRAGGKS